MKNRFSPTRSCSACTATKAAPPPSRSSSACRCSWRSWTIFVQFALILNAKIMVTNAAAAAARSAMTSLPEESPENVKRAACFMLVPVSPRPSPASARKLKP